MCLFLILGRKGDPTALLEFQSRADTCCSSDTHRWAQYIVGWAHYIFRCKYLNMMCYALGSCRFRLPHFRTEKRKVLRVYHLHIWCCRFFTCANLLPFLVHIPVHSYSYACIGIVIISRGGLFNEPGKNSQSGERKLYGLFTYLHSSISYTYTHIWVHY